MAGFVGMNIEEVRTLARQLQDRAGQIDQIMTQLTGQLGSTEWRGPDADRFRSEWDSHHRQALHRVSEALRSASQAANTNAAQQEQAANN